MSVYKESIRDLRDLQKENKGLKAMNAKLQRELTKALEVIAGVAKAMKGEGK